MGYRERYGLPKLIGTGLLMGALGAMGCGESTADEGGRGGSPDVDVLRGGTKAGLLRAEDCSDLLTKIQDDAVMKVKLAAARALATDNGGGGPGGIPVAGPRDPSVDVPVEQGDFDDGAGAPTGEPAPLPPTSPGQNAGSGDSAGGDGSSAGGEGEAPTGASETNSQVAGVDEADFVKVVKNGESMFVLHGNTLRKLKTWPAEETALNAASLTIEGSPSEMFVTDDGKAVIFSNVWGYGQPAEPVKEDFAGDVACAPGGFCGGYGYANFTKITIADVSGDTFKETRELYYEGSYVSSRRYEGDDSNVVRVVLQAASKYASLFWPTVEFYDSWGRPYDEEDLKSQLDEWVERTEREIRNTELSDWLPLVQEAKDGELVGVEPTCDSFYMPPAGVSDYGLTHVLSIDAAKADAAVGGVTIMGGAQTVYSNVEHLVLALPDYRWDNGIDFGFASEQRTGLHLFAIEGAATEYKASGWVPGHLPEFNAQFGIDEKGGVIRLATTGSVRDNPEAEQDDPEFWSTHTENHVYTVKAEGDEIKVVGKSEHFGHEQETVKSARFVGDRAYVVTFRQTDPLVAVDVSKPEAPKVLGDIEIPGFSQYMHPLDDNHLITLGQNANWGVQLQLFDVTDPLDISVVDALDFGDASSEGQYNHKAFTFYAEKSLLALPVYGYGSGVPFGSMLRVIEVDAASGFTELGAVDHSVLYTDSQNGCVVCYDGGWCDYYCSYSPEVRRGHFVSSDDATYVYSFGYAGVLVNDLSDLAQPLATVRLPEPQWNDFPWYGDGQSGDGASSGGSDGVTVDPVPPMPTQPPEAVDAGSAPAADAGVDLGG